jgi:diguanylate cyclase (GGDEF)-like protein/PAS domain S-box-containing protein
MIPRPRRLPFSLTSLYEVLALFLVPLFVWRFDTGVSPPMVPLLFAAILFVVLWFDDSSDWVRRRMPGKSIELLLGIHLALMCITAVMFRWESMMQVACLMVLCAQVRQRGSGICRTFQVWCAAAMAGTYALVVFGVIDSRFSGAALPAICFFGFGITMAVVSDVCASVASQERATAERVAAEDAVRRREALADALVRNAFDMIMVQDDNGQVTYASPAAFSVVGIEASQMIGGLPPEVHPEDIAIATRLLAETSAHPGEAFVAALRVRHANGHWVHVEVVSRDLRDDPLIGGRVHHARDVSEAHAVHERLLTAASCDALTGLANRRALMERMDADLGAGKLLSVLFVDLDGFKAVNDRHGHDQGDELLAVVGARLEELCSQAAVVSRLAGDEFVVLLEKDAEDACELAELVGASVRAPVKLAGGWAKVGASIGVALSENGDTASTLLHRADTAMYRVKRRRVRPDESAIQSAS